MCKQLVRAAAASRRMRDPFIALQEDQSFSSIQLMKPSVEERIKDILVDILGMFGQ